MKWRRVGTWAGRVAAGVAFGAAVGCHTVPASPRSVSAPRVPRVFEVEGELPVQQATATEPAGPADVPIDLGSALRLAGVDNPTINLAREQVREAAAGQLAARALLLPGVTAGGSYRRHTGAYQASAGFIREVDVQSLYVGNGAGTAGAGTVNVAGVWLTAHLGDAVYEPTAAGQRVAARLSEATAVRNATLLDVATAYLELAGAEARLDAIRQGEAQLAEVVRLTAVYAEKGQGRQADASRAAATADLLRREAARADEDVGVASARLCRLLALDPSARLRTPGGSVVPFRLVAEDVDLQALMADALRARPELAARAAEVAEAQTRVRQEKVRPWLPFVSAGFSVGGFGGGGGQAPSAFGQFGGRTDFDVAAVWTAQNLGVGNRARVRRADAGVGIAAARLDATVNQVRREVAEAAAEARAAAVLIDTTAAAVAVAVAGYALERERIEQGQGLPLEVLDSFRQLLDARLDAVRAAVAFDAAQVRLLVAVGGDPSAR